MNGVCFLVVAERLSLGSIGAEAADAPIRLNDLGGSRFHLHEDFARLSHAPIDVSVRVLPVRRISVEPGAQLSRHRGTKDHQRQTRNRQAEPNPLQAISFLPDVRAAGLCQAASVPARHSADGPYGLLKGRSELPIRRINGTPQPQGSAQMPRKT